MSVSANRNRDWQSRAASFQQSASGAADRTRHGRQIDCRCTLRANYSFSHEEYSGANPTIDIRAQAGAHNQNKRLAAALIA